MKKDMKHIDLQIKVVENRNEWRRFMWMTIVIDIFVHVANPNFLGLRL